MKKLLIAVSLFLSVIACEGSTDVANGNFPFEATNIKQLGNFWATFCLGQEKFLFLGLSQNKAITKISGTCEEK